MGYPKPLTAALLFAFLLVGAIGIGFGSVMGGNMDMIGCPFAGHDAICSMNPLEHIGMWQTLFAAIAAQSVVLSLVMLLAAAMFLRRRELLLLAPSPQPIRRAYNPDVYAYDPLRRFVARGLLHPKIF